MADNRNALGFGAGNPYSPPLRDFKNLNTWLERKIALTIAVPPNPVSILALYFQGYASGDSKYDEYYYANALAAGSQVYPSGISLFFDIYSWPGYWEFTWEYFINFLWNCSYILTLLIPVDFILASQVYNWEPLVQNILFYVPGLNLLTAPIMFWNVE